MAEIPLEKLADDVVMPLVGFGTWQLRGREAYQATRVALDVGYRHIDTATIYRNEEEVGRALRDSGIDRRDLFVTTKLPPDNAGRERETLTASLRALGTDYVDLWLVHWPPPAKTSLRTWREFLALRDSGLTRTAGVSNYSVQQIDELIRDSGEAPVVNQIPWSPFEHDAQRLAQHREQGVAIEGYSPLKRSNLSDPVIGEIAARHGKTPAQVILRWHLEHGITVIPKSAKPERIAANLDLAGFALDPGEISRIDSLAR